MIRGVSRNIIEISPRNCDYFEKLIVIPKSNNNLSSEELEKFALLIAGRQPDFLTKKETGFKEMLLSFLLGVASVIIFISVIFLFV